LYELFVVIDKNLTFIAVRNHVVHVSESNLITIAGGKWTTYRVMAQETVDTAVQVSLREAVIL
jgi:glycerol-3-phosphate dehydrogenase